MQAMPSIVEADRRCRRASGDAQMGRLFPDDALGAVREQNAHLGEVRGGRARRSMQAMHSIVEADRRCHHASGDAQMGRLFPDDSSGLPQEQLPVV